MKTKTAETTFSVVLKPLDEDGERRLAMEMEELIAAMVRQQLQKGDRHEPIQTGHGSTAG